MHFLLMCLFAAVIATVMAVVEPVPDVRSKVLYGLKVFGAFVGIGIVLAWFLYFIPF